jgi:hypothetical protein
VSPRAIMVVEALSERPSHNPYGPAGTLGAADVLHSQQHSRARPRWTRAMAAVALGVPVRSRPSLSSADQVPEW